MKKRLLKKITQKTIILLAVFILIFNIIFPTYSQADVGGALATPITSFALFLLDTNEGALQYYFIGGPIRTFTVTFDTEEYKKISKNLNLKPNSKKKVEDVVDDYQSWLEENFGIGGDESGWDYVVTKFSPAEIFSNQIPMFSINFIDPPKVEPPESEEDYKMQKTIASELQGTIASWYKALRMLAFVGMLSILVYVGIRIMLSSTASDKAKYKNMIMDWVIALCLLFFLHYIMQFTIIVTDSITNMVASVGGDFEVKLKKEKSEDEYEDADTKLGNTPFVTNLMGLARFRAQNKNLAPRLGYIIIYGMLVMYTIMFTFTYLKRVLMMAFLTVISPVVVITYPIDKISDGNAQGFNMWLKEYVFNALLQPVHLILYTVLVDSAVTLAADNPIYAIAAMAFILPAEQIMRKFFNFSKAQAGTMSGVGGFAGALVAKDLIGNIANKALGKGERTGGNGGNNSSSAANSKLRMQNKASLGAAFGGDSGNPDLGENSGNSSLRSAPGAGNGALIGSGNGTGTGNGSNNSVNGARVEGIIGNGNDAGRVNGVGQQRQLSAEDKARQEDYTNRRDALQNMIDNPDTTPEDRALYQGEVDYYNDKLNDYNGVNEALAQQEDYTNRRDALQNMIDDPDTTPEDRALYQDEVDYYNQRLSELNGENDASMGSGITPGIITGSQAQEALGGDSTEGTLLSGGIRMDNSNMDQPEIDEGVNGTLGQRTNPSDADRPNNTRNEENRKPNIIKGIGRVAKNKVFTGKNLKRALKLTAGGGMALAAGSMTLAGTGGDLSKAIGAAAGGYAAGSAMVSAVPRAGKAAMQKVSSAGGGIADEYREGAYGLKKAQEIKEENMMAKQKKEFMKDTLNKQKAKEMAAKLGINDYKKVMEDSYKLKTSGVKDENVEKTLEVAYGKPGRNDGVGTDKAAAVAVQTQKYGTDILLDEKKSKVLEKRFAKEIMSKGAGNLSEEQANSRAKEVMKIYEKFA